MSNILKEEINTNTQLQKTIKKGELIDDKLIEKIFTQHFSNENQILLDGIPRDLEQAQFILKFLKTKNYNIKIIDLIIDEEELKTRIINRYFCPKCHTTYNKITLPPKNEGICDNDGETLVQREDDTKEIFEHRYEIYKSETLPIINFFKNKTKKIITLDSSQTIQNLTNELKKKIKIQTTSSTSSTPQE